MTTVQGGHQRSILGSEDNQRPCGQKQQGECAWSCCASCYYISHGRAKTINAMESTNPCITAPQKRCNPPQMMQNAVAICIEATERGRQACHLLGQISPPRPSNSRSSAVGLRRYSVDLDLDLPPTRARSIYCDQKHPVTAIKHNSRHYNTEA